MWKPPERIRHETCSGEWPDQQAAAGSLLFSPLNCGRLEHVDRTWVPAMVPWRASPDGEVTEDVVDWYKRFAQGRPGALVVEATGIRDIPSGPLLRIGHDRFVPGLQRLVKAVSDASGGRTRLYIQLIDFLRIRRRPDRDAYLGRFLLLDDQIRAGCGKETASDEEIRTHLASLSDADLKRALGARNFENLTRGYRERVTDTQNEEIAGLPRILPGLFAAAARRAEQAGFHGVELHYAHAYTMASFLSRHNTRSDGYGGDLNGRKRLALEVLQAVRRAVSNPFVVGCRMLTDDCIEGGLTVADAAEFAKSFAAEGMDFISLSRGGKFEDAATPKVGQAVYPYTGPSGYECMPQILSDQAGPFGRNTAAARTVRDALRADGLATPTIAAGGIHNFSQAEAIIRDGVADAAGLARQALADPDWFEKVRTGRGDQVRLCSYTNYCEGLDQKHKMVTCQLWDRQHLTAGVKLTPDGKRRTTAPAWQA